MSRVRERGPWFWRLAIGGMLAAVLGLFAFVAFNRPPALAQETGCRLDRRDPAHTILMIDQSDPFNPNDFDWVYEFMDAEARALPKYGRLTVLTPRAGDPYQPAEIFERCSPGSGDQANPILENPRMVDDAWREDFYAPLRERVEAALTEDRQPASPLAESIYSIGDRADFQGGTPNRRLILVSDLMQHSDEFSFYRWGADVERFEASGLAEETPRLEGVDVVARIVPRQEYDLPLSVLRNFWGVYFNEAGADFSSVN